MGARYCVGPSFFAWKGKAQKVNMPGVDAEITAKDTPKAGGDTFTDIFETIFAGFDADISLPTNILKYNDISVAVKDAGR